MHATTASTASPEILAGGLVVFLAEGASLPEGAAREADEASGGLLSAAIEAGDFRGKAGEVMIMPAPGQARRLVLAGLGAEERGGAEALRIAAAKAARALREAGSSSFAFAPPPGALPWADGAEAAYQAAAEGALLGLYRPTLQRTSKREGAEVQSLVFLSPEHPEAAARGVEVAGLLAGAIAHARDLILLPSDQLTPMDLAREAQRLAEAHGLGCEVFDLEALRAKGFGALVGVGRGSVNPPCLISLAWRNGGDAAPIVLVGKGITFDTGGIGIKPPAGMEKMKYDMAGGAAVIAILRAAAALRLPLNLVGLVPAAENMPGHRALKPGDILTTHGGQTVEVNDTDAEGRLVLADAIAYAVAELAPQAILDMATLTGAVAVALGRRIVGVMGTHQGLVDRVLAAGLRAGERGWQLPLGEEFDEALRSELADLRNYGGRDGGAITAAAFLERFVGVTPWCHLDIAGTAWSDKDRPYRPKGPTGAPVRTVIELLRRWEPLPTA